MGLLTIRRIDTDERLNPLNVQVQGQGAGQEPSGCAATLALTEPLNLNPGQSISVNAPFANSCNYSNQSIKWFVTLDSDASQNNIQSPDAIGAGSFSPSLQPRTSSGSAFLVDGLSPTYIEYNGSIRAFSPETEVTDYLKTHVLSWESSAGPATVKTDSYRILPADGSADEGEDIPSYPGGFDSPDLDFTALLSPSTPPYNPGGSIRLVTTGALQETYSWFVSLDSSAAENNIQSPDSVGNGTHNPALQPETTTGSAYLVNGLSPTYIPYNGQIKLIVADSSSENNWDSTHNKYRAEYDSSVLSTTFRDIETIL